MTTQISNRQIYNRLGITPEQLTEFCQRWQILELALFGSILRDDFNANSDVDILVMFQPNHSWGLEFISMREQLSTLFNRPVDLMTKQSIVNTHNVLRRQSILNSAEVIYGQG
ncbi:MAG: DNA polymerase subunit beta [Arthrospira sp. PLM2.Bin9]|nr:nucleotidyltransferase family protein [Arthrospira sp. PLM2.Bin9]TVU54795.1 MAG: DNA polymerase subunit beta [Arthrospira sp. PLM2.Bin9]